MRDIRKVLCWAFGLTSLMHVVLSLRSGATISRHIALLTPRNLLIAVVFQVAVATITGVAWWSILKEKPSARVWGIAASLMCVLIFLRPIVFSLRTAWLHHVGALVVGIIGLITFLWFDQQHDPTKDSRESEDYESGILRL
jgi:uncharacterized membrane protein YhaH (DUF805 family)